MLPAFCAGRLAAADARELFEWPIGVWAVSTRNQTPRVDFSAKSNGEQRKANDARGYGATDRGAAGHDHQLSNDEQSQCEGMLQHNYDLQCGSLLAIAKGYKSHLRGYRRRSKPPDPAQPGSSRALGHTC